MFNLSAFKNHSDQSVLRYFNTHDSQRIYSYGDLYRQSIEVSEQVQKIVDNSVITSSSSSVAILLSVHSPAILPALVGIENAGCASCFLDPTDNGLTIQQRLNGFKTNIILCDSANLTKINGIFESVIKLAEITLFNVACVFVAIADIKYEKITITDDCGDRTKSSKVFFYASTSGSCGNVKSIGVTYKCFWPNITSLGKIYNVTNGDTIFVSSPPTFDPFMVDICLALYYGASLVMVNNNLRCDAKKLLNILFPVGSSIVSIMQITPSLFMRWTSNEIRSRIFTSESKLRILTFGGEAFPSTKTINPWTDWQNQSIRLFNLYGLTEMSCWASIYEIPTNDILTKQKIPIGQPIDEYTTFDVNADGELLLKSKVRKCFQPQITNNQITDDTFEMVLNTRDLVHSENGSMYFKCRTNSVIKFYGQKINLNEIEVQTKDVDGVEDAICVHDKEFSTIGIFVKINTKMDSEMVKRHIAKELMKTGVRVRIFIVLDFPLTTHGKVCRSDLLNIGRVCSKQTKSIHLLCQELINESLGTEIQFTHGSESNKRHKKTKTEYDSSFIHLGGSSLQAIQIVDEFERESTQSIPQLLSMLLDERVSIREILNYLSNSELKINRFSEEKVDESFIEIVPQWTINMLKCIDATPTVCTLSDRTVVSVGSHSKLLFNVLVENGEILSQLQLPDRIESQVIQMGNCGIVGCYDGYLYCFDIQSGDIKWKFDSGGMIKCRAISIDKMLIFGNYNESQNLWCLNGENGTLLWSVRIGTKSIYANPIKINEKACLVCSLDGTVAQVNCLTATIEWTFQANAPIFATPSLLNAPLSQIIVAAANGSIYGLNDGVSTWRHQIDGNIFATLECFTDEKCTRFVFGSQNHNVYCFEINEAKCKQIWKYKTNASIRSSAISIKLLNCFYIGVFTSDGTLEIINRNSGKREYQRKIDGDVFSTPALYNERLFVGSRNNYLYCIDLNDLFKRSFDDNLV